MWTIAILTVSSIPHLQTISTHFTWVDKIAHFAEYSIWTLFFLLMLKQEKKISNQKNLLLIVVSFGILLMIIDEGHQLFIPGRSADFLDMVADFSGLILMTFIFQRIQKNRLNLRSKR